MRPIALSLLAASLASFAMAQEAWMPYDPGIANGVAGTNHSETLANKVIAVSSDASTITIKSSGWAAKETTLDGPLFTIVLRDGRTLTSASMKKLGDTWRYGNWEKGNRRADELSANGFETTYQDPTSRLTINCKTEIREHAHYLRTEVVILADKKDADIAKVQFFGWPIKDAQVIGTVQGSPISNGTFFLGLEHPMSQSEVKNGIATCWIDRGLPLKAGQSVTYSAVVGAEAPGQARRSFASYVEMERARPYQPFLHYNSWYDLGEFNRYNEKDCLDRIHAFGEELVKKRGVQLSSFLFDDGWDDTSTNWQFHSGFPNGFTPLKQAAAEYGAAPGVWLSPWGGYGKPREERLATGKKNGYEIDSQGFALSGPKYYDLFSKVCLKMVTEYGINQFKFDGTGSPDKQYPGSKFDSDFDAAIQLIGTLRKANPSLFVNLTTGTWPSPFWTRYADSTWRGGSDHDFVGVGPDRQRWITYRDSDTYHEVVKRGPFYPLNSLMLHGLIYAQYADKLKTDPTNAFRDEIRSYFGNGTQLQEMYITPGLLSKQNWDDLAQAAKWSQENKDILKDSHWIGGDPEKLEVYGWASWSPKKSIIVLRNPSDQPQALAIEPRYMLEVPPHPLRSMRFTKAFEDEPFSPSTVDLEKSKVILLDPFQVLILEGQLTK
jgi:hypothetical protein